MARYLGPKNRLARKEGIDLGLKTVGSHAHASLLKRLGQPPGQHGPKGKRKQSEYGTQLREKQKVKRMYGVLEKQFRRYYVMARKYRGNTGEELIKFLERRLDNTLFRLGIAPTRTSARQFVSHGHVMVNGKIRYTHFGEGKYDETERMIQKLLKETGATISATPNNLQYTIEANTHETYLGYQRMSGLASPEQIVKNKPTLFTTPNTISNNSFALGGTWTIGAERAMPQKGSTLTFSFDAKEVFLVMRPNKIGQAGGIRIYLDDKLVTDDNQGVDVQNGIVTINVDRLYKLINLPKSGPHILKIEVLDGDIELYAFTFG